MTVIEIILIVVCTSVLSSIITTVAIMKIAPRLYDIHIKPDIQELPQAIGDKVEKGVENAGQELLPDFEARVKKGFTDGITDVGALGSNLTSNFIQSSIENLGLFTGGPVEAARRKRRGDKDRDR